MKSKTNELSGPALDWAVAKCEEVPYSYQHIVPGEYGRDSVTQRKMAYSTNWAQGGPIIERKRINVVFKDCIYPDEHRCFATDDQDYRDPNTGEYGPTPLIAAMRCYVASRLGDVVDVPEELS